MTFTQPKTIVGLIGANAPGGTSEGNTDKWVLVIYFAAWHYSDMPVLQQDLRIEMPVSHNDLRDYMDIFKPYQIIEVEVDQDESVELKRISKITRTDVRDVELEQIAANLQVPIEREMEPFGKLVYDRRFKCYRGYADWCNQPIEIMLFCSDPDKAHRPLETAAALFRDQANWSNRVGEYAVEQLLKLKNDYWCDDDEAVVSRDEFLSRMTLITIAVEENGDFLFEHDDDDLFAGHHIAISGDLIGGLTDANI